MSKATTNGDRPTLQPAGAPGDARVLAEHYAHLLDMLGVVSHAEAGAEIGRLQALAEELRTLMERERYVLAPARIPLSRQDIAKIAFQCGADASASDAEDRWSDGVLWIGAATGADGTPVHGLHISNAEHPEEGCITLAVFPAAPESAAGERGHG